MNTLTILWIDDEIELLKPHILFLQEKGHNVQTCNNGETALNLISQNKYDLVFLDEQMPGLSGIQTLEKIKSKNSDLPVIMITKSEEENIMNEAIGSKISDYLIKPVNPKQILLSIKKIIEDKKLISEKTSQIYQQDFRNIGASIQNCANFNDWIELYKRIVYWDFELETSGNEEMMDVLQMQKKEANLVFGKFIERSYRNWLNPNISQDNTIPILSHTLFRKKIAPLIPSERDNSTLFLIVIDNLRFDQWKIIKPIITEYFNIEEEDFYFSILPTATQYARNSLFAGLLPSEIAKLYPDLWVDEDEKQGGNLYEEELLRLQLKRLGKECKFSYNKILSLDAGKILAENIGKLLNNSLNVIVYNFVDMLSHKRTEMEILRELAETDSAYRSLTLSWFKHSPLLEIIKQISQKNARMIITTDHGSILVQTPLKVIGDKNTSTNLRYKQGKSLSYEEKNIFAVKNPAEIYLPKPNISTTYIFSTSDCYFVYPNEYNYFVKYFKNTFQHGGISLEEMIVLCVSLSSK